MKIRQLINKLLGRYKRNIIEIYYLDDKVKITYKRDNDVKEARIICTDNMTLKEMNVKEKLIVKELKYKYCKNGCLTHYYFENNPNCYEGKVYYGK